MTKPLSLKLNGKPFSLQRMKPSAILIKNALDKSPADEIFTTEQMTAICGVRQVGDYTKELEGYSHKAGTVRYWGNPKAIEALKAQVGA